TCSDTGIGTVELSCNDTVVSVSSLATATGQRCQRHCPPQTLDIDPLQNITLETLSTFHQQRSQKECPDGLAGLLGLYCMDYAVVISDGQCGEMNCRSGTVQSNAAVLDSPAMNNMRKAGPELCPQPYLGQATFQCQNGTSSIAAVTLIRQPVLDDSNQSLIGPSVFFVEDDRFLLCGCCMPPAGEPAVEPTVARDTLVILIWAAAAGGFGSILAAASGVWILKKRGPAPLKPSRVLPDDVANGVVAPAALQDSLKALALQDASVPEKSFALEDTPDKLYSENALALRDATWPDSNLVAIHDFPISPGHGATAISQRPDRLGPALREYSAKPQEWKHW
ncbi:unnamed protein product, partial [Polarella glacialis]